MHQVPEIYKGYLDRYLSTRVIEGEGIAIHDQNVLLTHQQVKEYTYKFSNVLNEIAEKNPQKTFSIGVGCGRSAYQIISLLGIWEAGFVYLPLNIEKDIRSLEATLQSAHCNIVVCLKADLQKVMSHSGSSSLDTIICFTSLTQWEIIHVDGNGYSYPNISTEAKRESGYLVKTSGSSGKPKLVLGSILSLDHFISWQYDAFGRGEEIRTVWLTEPTFDASFRDILLPLISGGQICIPSEEVREIPNALLHWIDKKNITHLHSVPSLYRIFLNELEESFKGIQIFQHLKYVFLSGEQVLNSDLTRWQAIFPSFPQIVNFYGATETTLIRTYHVFDYKVHDSIEIPVGHPIPDTSIRIVGQDGACKLGEQGEVIVQTAYPSLGYLEDGVLSQPWSKRDGLQAISYRTGDEGYINNEGALVLRGRLDDQIKIRGVRVDKKSIEEIAIEKLKLKDVKVVYESSRQQLFLFYTADQEIDSDHAKSILLEVLPAAHIPSAWRHMKQFPKTVNGKVDIQQLKKEANNRKQKLQNKQAFQTKEEEKLARLWSQVLKVEVSSRSASFFDLGGNSLNGIVLLSRIQKEYSRKIRLRDFFQNPKLHEMLSVIQAAPYKGLPDISPIAEQDYYPVSPAQRRMWVLHNMERNSITYNIKRAFEIHNELDIEKMRDAFENVILQQESLRTNFKIVEGVPVQFIRPFDGHLFNLKLLDFCSQKKKEQAIRHIANQEVHYHFDLESESLIRATLIKVENEKYVLLLNLHHIIADGWSMEILMRSLVQEYSQSKSLLASNIQSIKYKDYTNWQSDLLQSGQLDKQREYWLKELNGDIPILEFPTDKSRALIKTYEGKPIHFTIDRDLKDKIEALCQKWDVSLFMLLLTVTKLVLYKYTNQKDIILGSPVAGREHPSLTHLIGFFVNMIALRTEIDPEISFKEYLSHVKEKVLDGFDHQTYPFDQLVEQLDLPRDTGRSPIFDITFQVLNVEFWENTTDSDLVVKPFIADWERSQYDLSFFFKERAEDIFGLIEYNTSLFRSQRITRLIAHFRYLLNEVLSHPDRPIKLLSFLSTKEIQKLLFDYNASPKISDEANTVLDIINRNHKSDIILKGISKNHSYTSFFKLKNQIASLLVSRGIESQVIAVMCRRRATLIPAMLGVMSSRNIYLPLDPDHSYDRILSVLEKVDVKMIMYEIDFLVKAEKLSWELESVSSTLCLDSQEFNAVIPEQSDLMDRDLWNYIGKTAEDQIQAGGWKSSYTGLPFSIEEMEEYATNAFHKIRPYLSDATKVLEVGCSSGFTLIKIAPLVKEYVGIDLSGEILKGTQEKIDQLGLENVSLHELAAHEILQLKQTDFDVIIINSVIQSFGSYNYFRNLVDKVLTKSSSSSILFLGDIQDIRLRRKMMDSLRSFSQRHPGKNYKTKLIWDDELFYHPNFFKDLAVDYPQLIDFEISEKRGQIINELTLFRYDMIIKIDKDIRDQQQHRVNNWRGGIDDIKNQTLLPLPSLSEDDSAYIIFTSGTSGIPKAVEIQHKALLNQVLGFHAVYNHKLSYRDCFLLSSKYTFDVSVLEMFLGLSVGGTLVEIDHGKPLGAFQFAESILQKSVSWAYLPPSLLKDIFEALLTASKPLELKYLLVGVEPIKFNTLKVISLSFPQIQIVNGYGPTEATIVSTYYRFNAKDEYTIVPIGHPMPGYEVYVLDENLQLAAAGIPGQLAIAGAGLAKEYRNDENLTSRKFIELPQVSKRVYLTGDNVYWDDFGRLNFVGRADRQVKFNGYRIELEGIDTQVSKFPGIQSVLTRVFSLDEESQQIVSFVQASDEVEVSSLRSFLYMLLPPYMVPNRFVFLDSMPLTTHGKIDEVALTELIESKKSEKENILLPTHDLEHKIFLLFQELLQRSDFGIEDNFFELGGHSLIATRLISRAAKEFQIKIQLVDVFTHPTVKQLAERAVKQGWEQFKIDRVTESPEGLYPMSFAQKRLWVIDQLNPDDDSVRSAYNMVGLFELEGQLPIKTFNNAIQIIVNRHETLRTNFIDIDGDAYQKVQAHRTFELEFYQSESKISDDEFIGLVEKFASEPFDLAEDSLLRVILIEGPLKTYVLTLLHHIISDGWSMHRFSIELEHALGILNSGKKRLPDLEIQYKDYSAWINKRVDDLDKSKHYWESLVKDPSEPSIIPSDFKRPVWRTYHGDTIYHNIPADQTRAIKKYCAEQGVTLFALLNSALHLLIHRCSGLTDIMTGSPVTGRNHPLLEEQIGFYLNNIVVRSQPKGDLLFSEYLASINQQLIESLSHQEYPFDLLVEQVFNDRDPAHAPFFDIYLALQNNIDPILDFDGFKFKTINLERKVSRFDLNLMVSEGKNLSFSLQYNTDLYRRTTANNILDAFLQILAHVIQEDLPLRSVSLLSNESIQQQLEIPKANLCKQEQENALGSYTSLIEAFYQTVKTYPKDTALIEGNFEVTYEELNYASTHLANQLRKTGHPKYQPIGLHLKRGISRVVSILAVLKTGSAYLPIDPDLPQGRKEYQLKEADCSVLISDGDYKIDGVQSLNYFLNTAPIENNDEAIDGSDLAYILFTSGTTGKPKGVKVMHQNVLSLLLDEPIIQITEKDVWTLFHNYHFDFSVWEMWGALLYGGKLVVLRDDEVKELDLFADIIYQQEVTILNQTPMVFYLVKDILINKFSTGDLALSKVIFGGDKLSPFLLTDFAEKFPFVELINMYGITETTIHVTAKKLSINTLNQKLSNIGRAIPSLSVYVVDQYANLLPLSIPGQLVVTGKGLSMGYLKDSILTEEKFSKLPFLSEKAYFSGDRVRWLPSEDLEYLGRIDYQLKVRGHRVEAAEIEWAIEKFNFIKQAIVLKKEDGESERLLAFLEPFEPFKRFEEVRSFFPNLQTTQLPNGHPFFHLNETETQFMYKEIIKDDGYHLDKLHLSSKPIIVDAGANIGMFTFISSQLWPEAEIFAFEPIPEIFECLSANAKMLNSERIHLFNEGLSDLEGKLELTYYPFNTVMSGAGESDYQILEAFLKKQYDTSSAEGTEHMDQMLKEALDGIEVSCSVRSISNLIDNYNLDKIDLLKVDVEDWEEKIIDGIQSDHWSMIGKVIIEIHDKEGRLNRIEKFLSDKGYIIEIEQTQELLGTSLYNLIAFREDVETGNSISSIQDFLVDVEFPITQKELLAVVDRGLKEQLPSYMIPDDLILLNQLPVTQNGKIDRATLLQTSVKDQAVVGDADLSLSKRGELVLKIISEVLDKEVPLLDNFFKLGGNSLNATKVINRIKKALDIEIRVRDLFKHPIICDLVEYVDSIQSSKMPKLIPSKRNDHYPVSNAQFQLLTAAMIDGKTRSTYNMTGGMKLHGPLAIEELKHTFKIIIDRYEILRTYFQFKDGDFVQVVEDNLELPFFHYMVDKLTEPFCQKKLIQLNEHLFDLEKGPLLRIELFSGSQEEHFLAIGMHHIISDGWSMKILNDEVARVYNNLIDRIEPDLKPLRFQYRDFAIWQNDLLLNSEWLEKQEQFWFNELNEVNRLDLPYDYQTDGEITFVGKSLNKEIHNWDKVHRNLTQQSLTCFSFVYAATHILLMRLGGQNDIIIATPVAGRPLIELEEQIGFFVNTLPLRVKSDESLTVLDFAQSVQAKFSKILDYQLLPFNKIISLNKEVKSHRDLINVLMVYQNNESLDAKMKHIYSHKLEQDFNSAIFDLVFIFSPRESKLNLKLQFNTSLFDPATAEEIAGLIVSTIELMSTDMGIQLGEIQI